MQKVVVDTNVIVSSLIQRSYPFKIVHELLIEDRFILCLSEELMTEYYEVLSRPRFSRFPDFFVRAESILAFMEMKARKFVPSKKFDIISDKEDNIILELAAESSADYIVTGNTKDFTFTEFRQTKIVSPKQFWEKIAL